MKKLKEGISDAGKLIFTNAKPSFVTGVALSPDEQRAIAYGAVLSSKNDMHFDTIELYGDKKRYSELLENSWGITDSVSAKNTLDWLVEEGHRTTTRENIGYNDIFKIYRGNSTLSEETKEFISREYKDQFEAIKKLEKIFDEDYFFPPELMNNITTVSAWDYDRLVTVARWCNAAEYITRKEAWSYIFKAVEFGTPEYENWEAYIAATIMGRIIWNESSEIDKIDLDTIEELLSKDSILWKIPFKFY